MTPGARVAAAIQILDVIAGGTPAEKALTNWARASRFAGSKDRAAVRDHVFDALRCWRSFAYLGGAETGRGRMIGALRHAGLDPASLFTGEGHAPEPLSDQELAGGDLDAAPKAEAADLPDWVLPLMQDALGAQWGEAARLLRRRAPVFLRANLAKTTRAAAIAALAEDEIAGRPHALAETAIEVTQNPRRIAQSRAFLGGLVELQDAASQAVVDSFPNAPKVLDYCAGGGGKALALAARGAQVTAHDAEPQRMRDMPERAKRAGVSVACVQTPNLGKRAPFDLVLCDVPCSGSGAWRRSPAGKWQLTQGRLRDLHDTQLSILTEAAPLVAPDGCLGYVTCSLFRAENDEIIARFQARHPQWRLVFSRAFSPLDGGDGFFVAHLKRD
ncbi:Sun protein [Candidatus Rhodobacter oscarellae]|uniref:Sun protein n=1 Tax=Candidatus Rhodobacter oscarellae TaxID=1675527 RepID=A0A0J9E4X8_9RHOB|nr:RsmB/NOP family class I SAM-dependent RNA methyltransferase [Candidatus Rhodobacter lobularis]KMW56864.1 Sun protein [Candidatus Rhodobacter lobularis]